MKGRVCGKGATHLEGNVTAFKHAEGGVHKSNPLKGTLVAGSQQNLNQWQLAHKVYTPLIFPALQAQGMLTLRWTLI